MVPSASEVIIDCGINIEIEESRPKIADTNCDLESKKKNALIRKANFEDKPLLISEMMAKPISIPDSLMSVSQRGSINDQSFHSLVNGKRNSVNKLAIKRSSTKQLMHSEQPLSKFFNPVTSNKPTFQAAKNQIVE